MKYTFFFEVNGRIGVETDCDSFDEGLKLANNVVSEADFGPLEDIDWSLHHIEDEYGNRIGEDDK